MVGWGILGNATIARLAVAPAIARAANGRIITIGSRSLDRAKALTDQHGGEPVQGYEAVLENSAVDAIYIPLPNHLHYPWAIKALAAGKHVLVEKPFAMSATEATKMVASARTHKRHLAEAFMWRFHPRARRIKQMVVNGDLGKIGSIRAAFTFPVQPNGENGRLFSAEMGGGSLWDVGSYGVSVARWMLDEEPVSVTAQAIWNERGVDVNFVGTMRFPSCALAVVECGFQSALQQTFSILGNRTAVEFAQHDAFIPGQKEAHFQSRPFDAEVGETHTIAGADQYQLMIEQFGDVALGKTKPEWPLDEPLRQMAVLDALRLAAQSGQTVQLLS